MRPFRDIFRRYLTPESIRKPKARRTQSDRAVASLFAVPAIVSLVRLSRQYAAVTDVRLGTFLFEDLEAIATRERQELQAAAMAAAQTDREQAELSALRDQVIRLADRPLEGLTVEQLRELRDRVVDEAKTRSKQEAHVAEQERQREIHRLEVDLEAIPVEAADNPDHEAHEAFALFRQARGSSDQRARLELLKEARRRLPKHYRPERF